LTEQDIQASSPQENLDTHSGILSREDARSRSPAAAAEVEGTDIIEVEEHLPRKSKSSGSVTAVDLSSEHRQSDSSEDTITSRRCSLRKVRAKTRNSLSSDDISIVQYSPGFSRTLRCRTSGRRRRVASDVEPDSDDDDAAEGRTARSEKSRASRGASSDSQSASVDSHMVESTKKCYVKLRRMNDADLPPQVELIEF